MSTLTELARSRELLANLTMRDVRSQYKRTVLGNAWSLVNPLASMLIYTIVFGWIFQVKPSKGDPSGMDVFALWLLCGLLPWTFISVGLGAGMNALVVNANLVLKVYLPRAALVVSGVFAVGVTFLVEMSVLSLALLLLGSHVLVWVPVAAILVALLIAFALGLSLLLAIANVYFRDTQHFVTIFLQMWFYLTPILYPVSFVQARQDTLAHNGHDLPIVTLYKLNPMEHFVSAFRNVLYDNRWPSAIDIAVCVLSAVVAMGAGLFVFGRYEGRLAEEL